VAIEMTHGGPVRRKALLERGFFWFLRLWDHSKAARSVRGTATRGPAQQKMTGRGTDASRCWRQAGAPIGQPFRGRLFERRAVIGQTARGFANGRTTLQQENALVWPARMGVSQGSRALFTTQDCSSSADELRSRLVSRICGTHPGRRRRRRAGARLCVETNHRGRFLKKRNTPGRRREGLRKGVSAHP